jgi:26S proteasome regulatory subunit N10
MVLEAVVICVDNSDWTRNGDYPPTRMAAQNEAVNYICSMKTQANEENAVGVLTMAGKRIDVIMTPSRELGQIMSSIQTIEIGGKSNFLAGLKTAQLCLKNRANKNQRQRIVLFVGSPIEQPSKELIRLGKQLKKNNVSVDVVNFGSENNENENREILDAFVGSVNSNETSHLVNVPPGPHNLSDMILSAIMADGNAPRMGGAQDMVDAAGMDPELAMAIRMSLEEEQQRVAAQGGANASAEPSTTAPMAIDNDEEAMIAQAIAMSMQTEEPDVQEALNDPNFLNSLIDSLPEADKANLNVEDILASLNTTEEENKQQGDKKKEQPPKK